MVKGNKKFFSTLVCVLLSLALVLTACGGGKTASTSASPGTNQSNPPAKSGKVKSTQGVTDDQIVIGTWATLSGAGAALSANVQGMEAYFKYINEQGGINGRKIKLITYDDEYQPSKVVSIVKKMIEEDKVFAIVSVGCTACIKAGLPHMTKAGIPVVGVNSGADQFVKPVLPDVFGLLTNYALEGQFFVNYALDTLKGQKVGIIYQNDDFGKSGYQGALNELKKRGIQPVAEIPYNAADVDFSSPALKMKQANPDVILSFSLQKATAAFKKELSKLNVNVPYVVTGVTGGDETMFKLAGDSWTNVYSSIWTEIKKFEENLKKQGKDLSPSGPALYGYAGAEVFVEGLRRAGNDLTWENYIKQLETLKDWNDGVAFNVNYSSQNHYGTSDVVMIKVQDGKLVKASDILKGNLGN
jgi:branched-chain amino acid transport system substrate-binding protein